MGQYRLGLADGQHFLLKWFRRKEGQFANGKAGLNSFEKWN
jgi:hypothetical protein